MSVTSDSERILTEDILKHLYKCEQEKRSPTGESVAGAAQISLAEASQLLAKMADHQLLAWSGDTFYLTPAGREYALQVIRAHRLWERYLADETGVAEADWHPQADRHEHQLTPAEVAALSARLGHPTYDPHGDPIPSPTGDFVPHGGQPLTDLAIDQLARIVHLEDEPAVVYAQLVAEGLHPGMAIQLKEKSAHRIRFQSERNEHILAPIVARNISVTPLAAGEGEEVTPQERLSHLKIGDTARVVSISPACRGPERRRFLDLGILPGTVIKAEMVSPSGDPTAYLIRQSLIGLRKEQADYIYITRETQSTSKLEIEQ